jgi:hypothetical protein
MNQIVIYFIDLILPYEHKIFIISNERKMVSNELEKMWLVGSYCGPFDIL